MSDYRNRDDYRTRDDVTYVRNKDDNSAWGWLASLLVLALLLGAGVWFYNNWVKGSNGQRATNSPVAAPYNRTASVTPTSSIRQGVGGSAGNESPTPTPTRVPTVSLSPTTSAMSGNDNSNTSTNSSGVQQGVGGSAGTYSDTNTTVPNGVGETGYGGTQ
jgi:hypothetical protein